MDKFFKISERGSTVRTEIIAGLTTFFAMAYIVITNPNQIVSFNHLAENADPAFQQIWNAVYVASILGAVIGTLLMSLYAKMPFAQACGMGLNSFFFVSFVLPAVISGSDVIEGYQSGLVIILISGLIFLLISVTGLRSKIARALPDCLKKAIPAGIGLFIAFIGFQNVGIIQTNQYTLVQFVDIHGAINNGTFFETAMPALLALAGLLLIAVLEKFKVKGSVLITILAITVIYYILPGSVFSFDMSQVGATFKDFASIGLAAAFKPQSWANAFSGEGLGAIFSTIMLIITFCLVDMFDTIGTLYGTASQADMLDDNGDPISVNECMTSDAIATVAGSVFGTSTVTTYVESAAGVGAGGRTGLTSLVVAICFAVCLFLSPVASLVPACATAPALIYVGVLMLKSFAKVDMNDLASAVPAFLALVMMPLTYSISNGIGIGAIAYVLISLFTGKYKKKDIPITVIAALFVLRFVFVTM
ncbi:MAG TPA: NCS2 family permease [Candidatus Faeciplasma avium]|uniref:NCS2 family permease n=1 Tax=Candidatus Faeciplasma avium TaxID=2840798 RepID=A0A9D1T4M6_9FIRM|nr:NCS2 family permease [Candidatus Faeciplasma avium]